MQRQQKLHCRKQGRPRVSRCAVQNPLHLHETSDLWRIYYARASGCRSARVWTSSCHLIARSKGAGCAAFLSADKNVINSKPFVRLGGGGSDSLTVAVDSSGKRCQVHASGGVGKLRCVKVTSSAISFGSGIASPARYQNIFDRFYRPTACDPKNGRSRTGLGHPRWITDCTGGDRCGKQPGQDRPFGFLAGRPECLGSSILSVFHGV